MEDINNFRALAQIAIKDFLGDKDTRRAEDLIVFLKSRGIYVLTGSGIQGIVDFCEKEAKEVYDESRKKFRSDVAEYLEEIDIDNYSC